MVTIQSNKVLLIKSDSFTVSLPYECLTLTSLEETVPIQPQPIAEQASTNDTPCTPTNDIAPSAPTDDSAPDSGESIEKPRLTKEERQRRQEAKRQQKLAMQEARKQERLARQAEKRQQVLQMQKMKQDLKEQRMAGKRPQNPSADTPGIEKKRAMIAHNQELYAEQLAILHEEGFMNDNLNIRVLKKHNGNMELVIKRLTTINKNRQNNNGRLQRQRVRR